MTLVREDWDFSVLPKEELRAALTWEVLRECPDTEEVVRNAKLWLEGKLSARKPSLSAAQRRRWKRRNPKLSDVEKASIQATALFSEFIPTEDFHFLHEWTLAKRRAEYDRWNARHLLPLVSNFNVPWLRLPAAERNRLACIKENSRTSNVVRVGSWWDAVGHLRRERIDPGLPLRFDYFEYISVLLTINWRFTKKRILAAIARVLDEPRRGNVVKWNARGRKDRDVLVRLERIGIMRLLHHYTLSEIRLVAPEAFKMYERRKWYDERRKALKTIRAVSHYAEPDKLFPVSWPTKAQRSALPQK